MLEEHVRAQEDIEIMDGDTVTAIRDKGSSFELATKSGKTLEAKYLLIASGSRRKRLGVPGEKELEGKGVAYCSICDAPLFKGKAVAVVGGGNAGLEAVVDVLAYASKIYLLVRSDAPKGDAVTLERIQKSEKFTLLTNAQTTEVMGDSPSQVSQGEISEGKFVKGLKYKDGKTGEVKELPLDGVFVEIGAVPNSEFVKGLVELNALGEIVVDHKTQKTSHPRIWAVGDVSDVRYKQNNISAGDAVKAALNIYEEIKKGT
jgi:alkyl hydroperoxide reductase subunit F